MQEAMCKQYEEKSVPTLNCTLEFLKVTSALAGLSGEFSMYTWSRATLQRAMTVLGLKISVRHNHYDVALERRAIVAQRGNFIKKMREYSAAGRSIYYTDESWENKSRTRSRKWKVRSLRARLNVPMCKRAQIIAARVVSRNSGLVQDACLVLLGKIHDGRLPWRNELGPVAQVA